MKRLLAAAALSLSAYALPPQPLATDAIAAIGKEGWYPASGRGFHYKADVIGKDAWCVTAWMGKGRDTFKVTKAKSGLTLDFAVTPTPGVVCPSTPKFGKQWRAKK